MRTPTVGRLLLLLILGPASSLTAAAYVSGAGGRCWIRCGVISDPQSPSSTSSSSASSVLSFVSTVWDNVRYSKSLTGVDLQFVRVRRQDNMTMDTLLEAYMEIGSGNVSAVVGPYRQAIATATLKFGIPYFVVDVGETSDVEPFGGRTMPPGAKPYNLVSVVPHPSELYSVIVDILDSVHWTRLAVVYQDQTEGVRLIEELARKPRVHVAAWKLGGDDVRSTVRAALLQIRHLSISNVVVMTSRNVTDSLLDTALHLSMLSNRYNWLLTDVNEQPSQLARYSFTQANVTVLRLLRSHLPEKMFTKTSTFSRADYASVHDSLLTLYHGVRLHHRTSSSCQWSGSDYILPTLRKIDDSGALGKLSFREDGRREGYVIGVYGLAISGLIQLGSWNASVADVHRRLRLDYSALPGTSPPLTDRHAKLGALSVVVALEPPFAMLAPRDDNDATDANPGDDHLYRGYLVDLLEALAKHASFTYSLRAVPDRQRGSRRQDGTWSGLVGELIAGNASLALGPLAITPERYEVIDFTQAFEVVRLCAAVRHDPDRHRSLFGGPLQFVRPLSGSVWTLLGVVFVATTILLYAVDRLDVTAYPPPAGVPATTRLSLGQSAVCALTTMMLMTRYSPPTSSSTSSSAAEPRSAAGRLTVAALWGFSLVVIATYTANMAAMMTASRLPASTGNPAESTGNPSDSTTRRSMLSELRSGRLRLITPASSVHDVRALLFSGGDDVTSDVTKLVDDVADGIRSAGERSDCAFVSDSEVLWYQLRRLQSAANHLVVDTVALHSSTQGAGYAIGVMKGFAHTTALNLALTRLANDGTLPALRRKWLSGDALIRSELQATTAGGLSLYDVGGPFLLLAVVVCVLMTISVVRHCIRRRRTSVNHLPGAKLRTSENHVGYKPTPMTPTAAVGSTSTAVGERGGLIQCNSSSSGAPFDVVQIEQLTDTASLPPLPALDTPRARTRAAGILRHKETNF